MSDNKFNIKILNFAKGQELPVFKEHRNGLWIDYGSDNTYPQYLLDVFHNRSNKHKDITLGGKGLADRTNASTSQQIQQRTNITLRSGAIPDTINGGFVSIRGTLTTGAAGNIMPIFSFTAAPGAASFNISSVMNFTKLN